MRLRPVVLLAPAAGALADHFDRRLMMVLGDGGSVLGLGVVVLALSTPSPRLGHILLGVVLSSCLAALTEPALRASVSDLVDPQDHVRSSGLLQAASSARYLLSPALAGLLLPLTGLRALLVLDAATCLVTAACSWSVMRAVGRRPAEAWGSRADVVNHTLGGWRVLAAQPALRALVGLMTVMTLLLGTLQVLVKPILLPHADAAATGRAETLAA
ncbi:MFS transporter [Actinomyces lilanjuaniae]|uniref:MFS transporter n=1 Tax=Actinomyces lilanjuaniae TaxID=2321394 RepID=UPI001FA9EE3C|nr:MFS transporter [Actinomyces lilanjuaniae]